MSDGFVIGPLEPDHNRASFSCGVEALDRYLKERAGQDERRHLARTFVASPQGEPATVAGYFTLAATSIAADALSEDQRRRLPRYPNFPAALIGRLAVALEYQKRGLGRALVIDATERTMRSDMAAFALLVEAKDNAAVVFYLRNEFLQLSGRPMTLFLPMATFKRLLDP